MLLLLHGLLNVVACALALIYSAAKVPPQLIAIAAVATL